MKDVSLTKIEVEFLSKALDESIGKNNRYLGVKTKWKLENEDRFNADKAYLLSNYLTRFELTKVYVSFAIALPLS